MEETQRSRSRRSSGQAGRLRRCNLPVVARRAITKWLRLLAKNKDAGLPGEAHFLDLAIFADQQAVFAGLQLGLAELGGLREANVLGKGFGEEWHCQHQGSE